MVVLYTEKRSGCVCACARALCRWVQFQSVFIEIVNVGRAFVKIPFIKSEEYK